MQHDAWSPTPVLLTVDLVILTLRDSRLHILLVKRGEDPFQGMLALPGGFLNHDGEEILDAAHRELAEETALTSDCVHLEQLAVYGEASRDPRGRVVSVAHLAIAPELPDPVAGTDATDAAWIPAETVLSGKVRARIRPPPDCNGRSRTCPHQAGVLVAGHGVLRGRIHHRRAATSLRGRLGHPSRHSQFLSKGPSREGIHHSGRHGPQEHGRTPGTAVPGRSENRPVPTTDPTHATRRGREHERGRGINAERPSGNSHRPQS